MIKERRDIVNEKPKFLSLERLQELVTWIKTKLSGKVDKEAGKSLVDDAEIVKLETIEENAQANVIEGVSVNGVAQTVDKNKIAKISLPIKRGNTSNSAAIGNIDLNVASSQYAIAEGAQTTASGEASHAEGERTTSSGSYSHAEGLQAVSSGSGSHAEGTKTQATNFNAHAEGNESVASGQASHAEGSRTTASGNFSHSQGRGTIAAGRSQNVSGEYNIEDASINGANYRATYAEIVGNGTSDSARSNARTLDWNGNEVLAGKLTVGAAPSGDMDVATKGYVDTGLADKQDSLDFGTPTTSDIGKALMPKTIENGEVTEWEFGEAGMVDDVQINGTSIVSNKVAEIPQASGGELGLVRIKQDYGLSSMNNSDGKTYQIVMAAPKSAIKSGSHSFQPIVPKFQHNAVFYGLTKAAGVDMANSSNAVGTYTEEAKTAIQSMLGIDSAIADAISGITSFDFSVVQELPQTGVKGVIYLVAHSHDTDDGFDEYIWITDKFEKLGHCDVDLTDYVRNTDYATTSKAGVVKVDPNNGISILPMLNTLTVIGALSDMIKAGVHSSRPIVPNRQHEATFYGLAKAAGDTTQSESDNAVGTYTDKAKTAIKTMIGAGDPLDVQINGASIVNNGVANIPIASSATLGVVKVRDGSGLMIITDSNAPSDMRGRLYVQTAPETIVKGGSNAYYPITSSIQHASAFYGLAKAAGDTTQTASSNAVGTYTDEAKTAIKTMLGAGDPLDVQIDGTSIVNDGVANIPMASSDPGVVKVIASYGITTQRGFLAPVQATEAMVRNPAGSSSLAPLRPITPDLEDKATFYGLALAAGDTTQSQSLNAVGTYTDTAKTAIQTMLGIDEAISDAFQEGIEVQVSGTDPVIVANANTRYICGECATLTVTPPENGVTEIVFSSGTTPTALTLPATVKMPEWFTIESGYTYAISIENSLYGAVMMWAT